MICRKKRVTIASVERRKEIPGLVVHPGPNGGKSVLEGLKLHMPRLRTRRGVILRPVAARVLVRVILVGDRPVDEVMQNHIHVVDEVPGGVMYPRNPRSRPLGGKALERIAHADVRPVSAHGYSQMLSKQEIVFPLHTSLLRLSCTTRADARQPHRRARYP